MQKVTIHAHNNMIMQVKLAKMQSLHKHQPTGTGTHTYTQTHTHVTAWSKQHAPINISLIGAQRTPHTQSRTVRNPATFGIGESKSRHLSTRK